METDEYSEKASGFRSLLPGFQQSLNTKTWVTHARWDCLRCWVGMLWERSSSIASRSASCEITVRDVQFCVVLKFLSRIPAGLQLFGVMVFPTLTSLAKTFTGQEGQNLLEIGSLLKGWQGPKNEKMLVEFAWIKPENPTCLPFIRRWCGLDHWLCAIFVDSHIPGQFVHWVLYSHRSRRTSHKCDVSVQENQTSEQLSEDPASGFVAFYTSDHFWYSWSLQFLDGSQKRWDCSDLCDCSHSPHSGSRPGDACRRPLPSQCKREKGDYMILLFLNMFAFIPI